MKKLLLALLLLCAQALAQSGPAIFFTDLTSGPKTGGKDNNGVFVTIYGRGFGATQGASTVTVGGGTVASCPIWTDRKVACQLGANAATGDVVATVAGIASNGLPFTVRTGNIFYVSPTGSDSGAGSFSAPFATVLKGKNALLAGDTLYLMDGINTSAEDTFGAVLNLRSSGAPGLPKAIVAYPGANVTLGGALGRSVYAPSVTGGPWAYWVIAGMNLRATDSAVEMVQAQNWRVIGNDISCPKGNGASACVHGDTALYIQFLGNNVHDVGNDPSVIGSSGQKLYHSVYFSTDSSHDEIGWNTIVPNGGGCRGLQFHSSPTGPGTGFNQFDISIHDNVVHDTRCDGINLATVDPTKGPVSVFNNIIYRAGRGPDPPGNPSNYSCIAVLGDTNAGSPPGTTAVVKITNNTMCDCGSMKTPDSGGMTIGPIQVVASNNIFYAMTGETYFTPNSKLAGSLSGSSNIFWGAGTGPAILSGNINADPAFVNLSQGDFHFLPGSPAISAKIGANPDLSISTTVTPPPPPPPPPTPTPTTGYTFIGGSISVTWPKITVTIQYKDPAGVLKTATMTVTIP